MKTMKAIVKRQAGLGVIARTGLPNRTSWPVI